MLISNIDIVSNTSLDSLRINKIIESGSKNETTVEKNITHADPSTETAPITEKQSHNQTLLENNTTNIIPESDSEVIEEENE